MKTKKFILLITSMIFCLLTNIFGHNSAQLDGENYYNVKSFGALGNGVNYDTEAIQVAINRAFENGGGTIIFPPGKYLIKTILLKDNITLKIDNGVTILGSREMQKYRPEYGSFKDSGGRKFGAALIYSENSNNISIEGNGIIDGQGFTKYYPSGKEYIRPSILRLKRCKNVKVKDITLLNSAAWTSHYIECEDLLIRGVTIRSYSNKNNDGIDIVGCKRVTITECNIDTEDDSIVLKALSELPCKDIVISNCIISGLKSAIKTGTESLGGFENISISNCTIYGTRGISLITVDGGTINNITISNISMRDSYAVIVMRLGERMRPYSVPEDKRPEQAGEIKNISISNIQAVGVTESNDFISGIPGHFIENVTLNDIRISYLGGGKKEDSNIEVPELPGEYPKAKMFGVLPAYGMYIRHARNIVMNNVQYYFEETDYRSAIFCEDVENITIERMQAESSVDAAPLIKLKDTKDICIRYSKSLDEIDLFLYAEGNSGGITLQHNFYSNSRDKYKLEIMENDEAIKIIE